jgi:hypothetical protein
VGTSFIDSLIKARALLRENAPSSARALDSVVESIRNALGQTSAGSESSTLLHEWSTITAALRHSLERALAEDVWLIAFAYQTEFALERAHSRGCRQFSKIVADTIAWASTLGENIDPSRGNLKNTLGAQSEKIAALEAEMSQQVSTLQAQMDKRVADLQAQIEAQIKDSLHKKRLAAALGVFVGVLISSGLLSLAWILVH